jgi:hypothetical protein
MTASSIASVFGAAMGFLTFMLACMKADNGDVPPWMMAGAIGGLVLFGVIACTMRAFGL